MAQLLTETEDFVQDYQGVKDGASTSSTDPEYDAWFRRHVEAGLKAYKEGRIISNAESKRRALERRNRLLAAIEDSSK